MSRREAVLDRLRRRATPNHWSSMFGVISVGCLAVLVVTGLGLMVFYDASSEVVRYGGSYPLLRDVPMSKALASVLHLSFDVRGGLLLRQAHHWAALVLPAALIAQLLATFFTGAFRRPRRLGWVLLFGVVVLTLAAGWSGYALPDDALSGTGLRIAEGVMLGIPVIGTWVSGLLFGAGFPGGVIGRMYGLHLVVSVVVLVVVGLRIRLTLRQQPPQFAGPGRSESTVVGLPTWPAAAVRAAGLFVITAGVLVVMAGTLQISPVWVSGPASSGRASAGSQPDWYTAFLDGALRLVPAGWEVVWLGRTWTLALLLPLVTLGLFLVLVATYPFLEDWVAGDRRDHHLLDRPRNAPARTGIGVAGVVFYGTLLLAGSADLIATQFSVSFEGVIWVLRGVVLLGPPLAYVLTRRACRALQAQDRERLRHGAESGVIVRLPGGGYVEPHAPLPAGERRRLVAVEQHQLTG